MIVLNGEEYQDEASFVALTHPDIPDSLKTHFKMPLESPEKPAGALKSEAGTPVAPEVSASPEPSQGFMDRLSILKPLMAMARGPNLEEDKKILQGIWDSAVQAFKLPGDVAQGKIDPSSPQAVERAFDLGTMMVFGPMPVAKKMADGTLGSFAGVRAKNMDNASYQLAVDAEKQGFKADDVYKSTGWFKGADGAWRFEIDDSASKFFPENLKGGQKLLGDVLAHKELFEAYPELKSVKVREAPSLGNGASYDQQLNLIQIGSQVLNDKGILMHEVQHAIQSIEGFAKGGTPGKSGKDFQLKYEQDIRELRPEMLNLSGKERSGEFLSAKEQSRLDYLKEVFQKYAKYARAADDQARENYKALAGEVEARNTQHRVDLTAEERLRFNPVDSEDFSRAEQLVRTEPSMTTPYVARHPYDGKPDFHTYE